MDYTGILQLTKHGIVIIRTEGTGALLNLDEGILFN